jgi:hypothetical protein
VTLSDEIDDAGDAAELGEDRKLWVKQGRKIDAQRRRRGGNAA